MSRGATGGQCDTCLRSHIFSPIETCRLTGPHRARRVPPLVSRQPHPHPFLATCGLGQHKLDKCRVKGPSLRGGRFGEAPKKGPGTLKAERAVALVPFPRVLSLIRRQIFNGFLLDSARNCALRTALVSFLKRKTPPPPPYSLFSSPRRCSNFAFLSSICSQDLESNANTPTGC